MTDEEFPTEETVEEYLERSRIEFEVLLEQIRTNTLPPWPPELQKAAEEAIERGKNDTRTDEEKMEDAVNWLMYGFGEDDD